MASRKCGVARKRSMSRSLDDMPAYWDYNEGMNAVSANVNAIRDQVMANNQAIANNVKAISANSAPSPGTVHAAETNETPSSTTVKPTSRPSLTHSPTATPVPSTKPVPTTGWNSTSKPTPSAANHSPTQANPGSTNGSVVVPTPLPVFQNTTGTTQPYSSSTTITAQTGSPVATVIGVSLGAVATLAIVVAVVLYVHRHRRQLNAATRLDKQEATTYQSHSGARDNSTGTIVHTYVTDANRDRGFTSPWDDEALVAVRVPLEAIHKGELISRGGFGEVYRGRYIGEDVAIKTLLASNRKNTKFIKTFQTEIKLMAALEHPRIVRFVGVAWESLSDLCVVTEFMAGGDLRSLLESFEKCEPPRPRGFDSDKLKIALHVAHALVYLHTLDPVIVHRDLKSRNILLDAEWNAKITDFGVSRERGEDTMTAGVGSMLWMAPEVMLGERYDQQADMFSFGVVLSELDTQQLPYANQREDKTGRAMQAATLLRLVSLGQLTVSLTDSEAYRNIQDLARRCVSLDPHSRPTASEALHCIHLALAE